MDICYISELRSKISCISEKTKKNEFSFGISLDLHYLCTQNLIGYVETAESFVTPRNTTI